MITFRFLTQILYANEGVAKNPEEKEDQKQDEVDNISFTLFHLFGHCMYIVRLHKLPWDHDYSNLQGKGNSSRITEGFKLLREISIGIYVKGNERKFVLSKNVSWKSFSYRDILVTRFIISTGFKYFVLS